MMTRKEAGKLIHSFTAAHGGTAFLLSQVPFGDTAALTAETIAMVALIAKNAEPAGRRQLLRHLPPSIWHSMWASRPQNMFISTYHLLATSLMLQLL